MEAYYKWTGMDFGGKFVDPQVPKDYPVLCATGNKLLSYDAYLAEQNKVQGETA